MVVLFPPPPLLPILYVASILCDVSPSPFPLSPSNIMANITASALTATELLYADTDFTQLTWLERLWVQWYTSFNDPAIATGLMSFLLHEIVYFGRSIPWIIVDAIPYFRKWKLQPNKIPTPQEQWECTKQVLFSHFTVELPQVRIFAV